MRLLVVGRYSDYGTIVRYFSCSYSVEKLNGAVDFLTVVTLMRPDRKIMPFE